MGDHVWNCCLYPIGESSECGGDNSESDVNVLAIAVAVPIIALVVVVFVIVWQFQACERMFFPCAISEKTCTAK